MGEREEGKGRRKEGLANMFEKRIDNLRDGIEQWIFFPKYK